MKLKVEVAADKKKVGLGPALAGLGLARSTRLVTRHQQQPDAPGTQAPRQPGSQLLWRLPKCQHRFLLPTTSPSSPLLPPTHLISFVPPLHTIPSSPVPIFLPHPFIPFVIETQAVDDRSTSSVTYMLTTILMICSDPK
jgi:hypothetical protein